MGGVRLEMEIGWWGLKLKRKGDVEESVKEVIVG